jgi:feruloyl-CoA synthase
MSPAYSLLSRDFGLLRQALSRLHPRLIFVADGDRFDAAVRAAVPDAAELVVGDGPSPSRPSTRFADLLATRTSVDVRAAHERVGPDTIAKILFTSGSTGVPKGVVNTHRMLTSNQQMIAQVMPFLGESPPVLVDWLPWHHTFGGNHNFGLVVHHGGSLFIDEGKPLPGLFERTVANLREVAPTIYLNVPKGFEELIGALRRDPVLRQQFFSRVRLLFYAAAHIGQHVVDQLQAIAVETCGERIAFITALGATETAPLAVVRPWQSERAGSIGLPAPGLEAKLVPCEEKLELRVRGPNVTPGYWRTPDATGDAFDEEGFYRLGDAVKFVDPADINAGLLFDGRIAEDFKLATGTWVNVGALRVRAVAHFAPYVRDVVITGHDRDDVGMLVVPDGDACRRLCPAPSDAAAAGTINRHPAVRSRFSELLATFAQASTGSATRITRLMLLDDPPSLDAQEITDKGSLNQRAMLTRRAALVEALYSQPPAADVITFGVSGRD